MQCGTINLQILSVQISILVMQMLLNHLKVLPITYKAYRKLILVISVSRLLLYKQSRQEQ